MCVCVCGVCVYVLTHMNTLTAIIVRILNFTLLICVQCLLAIGIISSFQQPDPDHPCVGGGGWFLLECLLFSLPRYGFPRARCVYSLISGVGFFFLGAGVIMYHGI